MIMAREKEVNRRLPESPVEQSVIPQNCLIVAGTPCASDLMDVINRYPESGLLLSAAFDPKNGENLTESEIARRWPWLKQPASLLEMLDCVQSNEIEVGVTVFPLSDQHHRRLFQDSINSLMRPEDANSQTQNNFPNHQENPVHAEKAPLRGSSSRAVSVSHDGKRQRRLASISSGSTSHSRDLRLVDDAKQLGNEATVVSSDGIRADKGGILLVEDQDFIAHCEQDLLESAGYTVFRASNGAEAVEKFKAFQKQISLVLLDLFLPVMSGSECLEELLKLDPSVKVVVVSGGIPNDARGQKVMRHVLGYVQKPCRGSVLVRNVEMALAGKTFSQLTIGSSDLH